MPIVDDDSIHWVINRVGVVSTFAFVVLNAIAVVVLLIFFSTPTSPAQNNFLYLVMVKLDGFLFWLMFGILVASAVGWAVQRFHQLLRALVLWALVILCISGIGWWLLHLIAKRGEGLPM